LVALSSIACVTGFPPYCYRTVLKTHSYGQFLSSQANGLFRIDLNCNITKRFAC